MVQFIVNFISTCLQAIKKVVCLTFFGSLKIQTLKINLYMRDLITMW